MNQIGKWIRQGMAGLIGEWMKPERVEKQDGKVFEIRDVRIDKRHLSPHYSLEFLGPASIKETGLLTVFKLHPVSGTGPSFVGRWDGGSRDEGKSERNALDIDITGVDDATTKHFKHSRNGYLGHWTKHIPGADGHCYDVCIKTPNDKVFEGTVCFSVLRKLAFEQELALEGHFAIEKGPPLPPEP